MKHLIPIMLSLLLIVPFKVRAEEMIKRGETLNLDRCIGIALKMYPNIVAAKNTVKANISRVGESKANIILR